MGQTACTECCLAASEAAETSSHPSQPARKAGRVGLEEGLGSGKKGSGGPRRVGLLAALTVGKQPQLRVVGFFFLFLPLKRLTYK